jgi:pSer/pThr/pTyr-binding forkhead associated (FHA) protein
MKYRLLHQGNDVGLAQGEYLIGRSPQCAIRLDDPTVSRHHALLRVMADVAEVEDLGSRNGISVNGRTVSGRQRLTSGDRIKIVQHDLVLVEGSSPHSNDTTAKEESNPPEETLALLGELADKALVLGNPGEAERILRHYLEAVLKKSAAGVRPSTTLYRGAIQYAASLAGQTRKPRWLNYIFELSNQLELEVPADVVQRLYEGVNHLEPGELTALREYISIQRARRDSMSPRQRFVLGRTEGLLRLLRS